MSSKETLSQIWDILIKHAGAAEEGREVFIASAGKYKDLKVEYRFGGALGFGGKVWLNNGRHPYVNGYREDYNPEMRQVIKVTNEALKVIS